MCEYYICKHCGVVLSKEVINYYYFNTETFKCPVCNKKNEKRGKKN
ncbi:MAG: hypothetical protein PWQ43_756 [Rikenellaceae bacterium]|nr:hypothetical protein [Rikenellaceae bacterium]